MSLEIGRSPKQAGPARHTFLKRLSGGIAAALLWLSASNALGQTSAPRWQQVPGPAGVTLKQISVGNAEVIWVLDTAGYPWKWTGSAWQKQVSTGTVSTISAASDGTLWATQSPDSMRVLTLNPVKGKLTSNIPPTGIKQVAALDATNAWGLDSAGTLFRLEGTIWTKKLGTVSQISVGWDGTLWATNPPDSKRVLRWGGGKWNTNLPQGMVYVSVGSAHNIWGLDSADQIFKWNGSAWQKMPGALRNIAAAGDGTVWGLNAKGSVYKWVPSTPPATAPAAPTLSNGSPCSGNTAPKCVDTKRFTSQKMEAANPYIFFGKVDVVIKAAAGAGIVTDVGGSTMTPFTRFEPGTAVRIPVTHLGAPGSNCSGASGMSVCCTTDNAEDIRGPLCAPM